MTNDPRHQKDENALDQDIAFIRSAWAGREQEEPPALLDQAVMNRARRHLEKQGQASRKRRSIKWVGAFATASVVVLALTIVLEQEQNAPVPAINEADGLRLDADMPSRAKPEAGMEAIQQKAPAENMSDQARSEPLLRRSAAIVADEKSADALTETEDSKEEVPGPDAWIRQLLDLKKSGQAETLSSELARFRAAYPDYPLPPELEDG